MIVVDASVLAPAVADGGDDGDRYRQRLRGEQLAAPDLMRIEAMSVIRRQLGRGLLAVEQADRALEDLLALPVTVFPTAQFLRRGWELRGNVTAYDACYIALAESLGCRVLTADARLSHSPGPECVIEVI